MPKRWSINFIRLGAPLLALGFAGAAMAEPSSGGTVAQAVCLGKAQQQYLIDLQQCTSQLGNISAYYSCRDTALLHYAIAQSACGRAAATVSRGGMISAAPSRLGGFGRARPGAGSMPVVVPPVSRGAAPQKPAGQLLPRRR